jgi:hypothetical protein
MARAIRQWLPPLAAAAMVASAAAPALAQQAYPNAEAAADAFAAAIKGNDKNALQVILGADWQKFVPTEEIDREDIDAFIAAWDQSHHIEPMGENRAALAAGQSGWTLPVPLVKNEAGWHFDPAAGADEMKTRRIGRNELATMQAALAYFDAQKDYARVDRDGDNVLQYAQKFVSSPGKHDGLYWPAADNEEESPLGPFFDSTDQKVGQGYHGYRYKILTAQGKDAPGGAYDYLIKNRMVAGFALVAWPIDYGDSGVMSFMISHDGQLYEKDLGEDSEAVAKAMQQFDPDRSWNRVAMPGPAK